MQDKIVINDYIENDPLDVTLKLRGSSNQMIINIPESLKQGKVITID